MEIDGMEHPQTDTVGPEWQVSMDEVLEVTLAAIEDAVDMAGVREIELQALGRTPCALVHRSAYETLQVQ